MIFTDTMSSDPAKREAPAQMRTKRLVCSRFTLDHVDALGVMDRDMTVQQWLFGKTYTVQETRERAERRIAFWNEHGAGDYIVHTLAGEFVGFAGFFPSPRPDAIAIGYALMPDHWRKGYGSELARLLTDTALTLGRAEIVATVRATNTASRRIVENLGYEIIGSDLEYDTLTYRFTGPAR